MTLRTPLFLAACLIGTCALAQSDTIDTRLVPYIDGPVAEPLEPDSTRVLMLVEEMPEFPGGMPALSAYVGQHLSYPREAKKKHIEGLVLVQFIVEQDGSTSNARVLRGIGGGCDEEALRVVQQMPAWKPGQQGGKAVRVRFSLPIRFKLVD